LKPNLPRKPVIVEKESPHPFAMIEPEPENWASKLIKSWIKTVQHSVMVTAQTAAPPILMISTLMETKTWMMRMRTPQISLTDGGYEAG